MIKLLIINFNLKKNNTFLTISNSYNNVLFKASAGCINFQNKNKQLSAVFIDLVKLSISYISAFYNICIYFILIGFKKRKLKLLYNLFMQYLFKYKIKVLGFNSK